MSSHLSSREIEQLAPTLGSLARLIASGSNLNEPQLKTLMLGTGLDYNPTTLQEMKLWGRLLKALHEQPIPELRLATVEALMLRNLPEASVLLAIDTVTSRVSTPASPSPAPPTFALQAIPASLDFGMLTRGLSSMGEFDIHGGPGYIVVESDQLRVTPTQFGPGTTRVQVQVKSLPAGMLWTTLKLITHTETVEVPVLAKWMESPASTPGQPGVAPVIRSTQAPSVPAARATQLPANPFQSIDITSMIEQAMGITPVNRNITSSEPVNTLPQQAGFDANEEILEQLRDLLG